MWLATLDGFFSTVTDTQEPSRMLIRARCEKDINNLFNRYRDKCPSMRPPTSDDARDYRYRLSISQKDWVKVAGLLAGEVTYPNFKMAVQERADQANKSAAYSEIWWTMRRVQMAEGKDDASKTPVKRKAGRR